MATVPQLSGRDRHAAMQRVPQAMISSADLLLATHVLGTGAMQRAAECLGLRFLELDQPQPVPTEAAARPEESERAPDISSPPSQPPARGPDRPPSQPATNVVYRPPPEYFRAPPRHEAAQPAASNPIRLIRRAEPQPEEPGEEAVQPRRMLQRRRWPHEPLFDPRMQAIILKALIATYGPAGRIDEARLAVAVAGQQSIRRLPRRRVRSLPRRLHVWLDQSQAMMPYRRDQTELVAALRHLLGSGAVSERRFDKFEPGFQMPPEGASLLIVSEFGTGDWLNAWYRHSPARVQSTLRSLHHNRNVVVGLTPTARASWPSSLYERIRMVRWDRSTTISIASRNPRRGIPVRGEDREDVPFGGLGGIDPDALALARLCSQTPLVEPELLRRLRMRLAPHLSSAAEARFWFSALVDRRDSYGSSLDPAAAAALSDDLPLWSQLRLALDRLAPELGDQPDTPLLRHSNPGNVRDAIDHEALAIIADANAYMRYFGRERPTDWRDFRLKIWPWLKHRILPRLNPKGRDDLRRIPGWRHIEEEAEAGRDPVFLERIQEILIDIRSHRLSRFVMLEEALLWNGLRGQREQMGNDFIGNAAVALLRAAQRGGPFRKEIESWSLHRLPVLDDRLGNPLGLRLLAERSAHDLGRPSPFEPLAYRFDPRLVAAYAAFNQPDESDKVDLVLRRDANGRLWIGGEAPAGTPHIKVPDLPTHYLSVVFQRGVERKRESIALAAGEVGSQPYVVDAGPGPIEIETLAGDGYQWDDTPPAASQFVAAAHAAAATSAGASGDWDLAQAHFQDAAAQATTVLAKWGALYRVADAGLRRLLRPDAAISTAEETLAAARQAWVLAGEQEDRDGSPRWRLRALRSADILGRAALLHGDIRQTVEVSLTAIFRWRRKVHVLNLVERQCLSTIHLRLAKCRKDMMRGGSAQWAIGRAERILAPDAGSERAENLNLITAASLFNFYCTRIHLSFLSMSRGGLRELVVAAEQLVRDNPSLSSLLERPRRTRMSTFSRGLRYLARAEMYCGESRLDLQLVWTALALGEFSRPDTGAPDFVVALKISEIHALFNGRDLQAARASVYQLRKMTLVKLSDAAEFETENSRIYTTKRFFDDPGSREAYRNLIEKRGWARAAVTWLHEAPDLFPAPGRGRDFNEIKYRKLSAVADRACDRICDFVGADLTLDQATAFLDKMERYHARHNDKYNLVDTLIQSGKLASDFGSAENAERAWSRAIAIRDYAYDQILTAHLHTLLSGLRGLAKDAALAHARTAVRIYGEIPAFVGQFQATAQLCTLLVAAGRWRDAEQYASKALKETYRMGYDESLLKIGLCLAQVQTAGSRYILAEAGLGRLLDLAARLDRRADTVDVMLQYSRLFEQQNASERKPQYAGLAAEYAAKAFDISLEIGNSEPLTDAFTLLIDNIAQFKSLTETTTGETRLPVMDRLVEYSTRVAEIGHRLKVAGASASGFNQFWWWVEELQKLEAPEAVQILGAAAIEYYDALPEPDKQNNANARRRIERMMRGEDVRDFAPSQFRQQDDPLAPLIAQVRSGTYSSDVDQIARSQPGLSDAQGVTFLMAAAASGSSENLQRFLDLGADPRALDRRNRSALHHAAAAGHVRIVERLLDLKKLEIDGRDADNVTPLMLAVSGNHVEAAATLIEYGADVRARNDNNETPLHLAARSGRPAMVDILLAHGEDPDAGDVTETPLLVAARAGQSAVVSLLLRAGANPMARTANGETALHLAALGGSRDIAKILLATRSAAKLLSERTTENASVTQLAADHHPELALELIAAGAPEYRIPKPSEQMPYLAWQSVSDKLQPAVEAAIATNRGRINIPDGNWMLRTATLPFYRNAVLLVIEDWRAISALNRFNRQRFLIVGTDGDYARLMNWTNEIIYDANHKLDFFIDEENVRTYAKFFFHMVRGQLGNFIIVEDEASVPWLAEAKESDRERVRENIRELRIVEADQDFILLDGTVVFKNALFETKIKCKREDGLMELLDEAMLLEDLPVEVAPPPPLEF